ncbi:MAG TPA: methylamine dehydrogenase accessory protein MauD [Myxococcota bacterium]|jgi:methylamine dehydrogenase accessory protein MauD|nr:methylamine dehydrogenase accessory protein MauD [Myxococcota bacterium]
MSDALLVSNALLWLAVVVLAALVAALLRQVGVLHERIAPVGALVTGPVPAVGQPAPLVAARELGGSLLELGGPSPDGRATLLFFLSPSCPVCKTLLPIVTRIARSDAARLRVVLASDGPPEEHLAFAREAQIELPYVLGSALGLAYRVGKLPWAALVDGSGVLRAQGLVNTREHLESLFEAQARGVASLDEWLRAQPPGREVATP